MTKFTAALITMLVAGVVPFGKAICQYGEVGLGEATDEGLNPVSSTNGSLSVITFETIADDNAKIGRVQRDPC